MKNVILIGMTGSFKSTAGRAAAKLLGLKFFDADDEYEKKYGKISVTFAEFGESVFRDREAEVLKELAVGENRLISCGGGIVTRFENIEVLRRSGTVIQLCASPETLYERIRADKNRPVTSGKTLSELARLYEDRRPLYDAACDFTIDNTHLTPDETAKIIAETVLQK